MSSSRKSKSVGRSKEDIKTVQKNERRERISGTHQTDGTRDSLIVESGAGAANSSPSYQQVPPMVSQAREENFKPGALFIQLATQEEDTPTPSLFKLGWLSSITK